MIRTSALNWPADYPMRSPQELYEAANRAAADSIRFRREGVHRGMVELRRGDSRALRALARHQIGADS